jgi:Protein of unknown function (DUF4238)
MGEPRKHHFIPSFYLAQWATNTDRKLIEFSRIQYNDKLVSKPVGPDGTGFEFDLYEAKDLPPDQRQYLETVWFNYLDQTAFRALEIHLGESAAWTNELINAWSRFVFGLHFRHPDAMPELRAAAKSIWEASGPAYQDDWEKIKKAEHPGTFDEYLATIDPFTAAIVRLKMLIKTFDNPDLVGHLNQMPFAVVDVSQSPEKFLTSDRPVCISNLGRADGVIFLPISPTKLFVAANDNRSFGAIRAQSALDLVRRVNNFVVGRARRYVWGSDKSMEQFVREKMSTQMEPLPLFPNIGKYPGRAPEISSVQNASDTQTA